MGMFQKLHKVLRNRVKIIKKIPHICFSPLPGPEFSKKKIFIHTSDLVLPHKTKFYSSQLLFRLKLNECRAYNELLPLSARMRERDRLI